MRTNETTSVKNDGVKPSQQFVTYGENISGLIFYLISSKRNNISLGHGVKSQIFFFGWSIVWKKLNNNDVILHFLCL